MSEKPTGKITITHLRYESRMVPMVLVGKTDNHETIYVRFRWGLLTIRRDSREPPPNAGAEGLRIFGKQVGGPYEGWIDYNDLRAITAEIINWPTNEPD